MMLLVCNYFGLAISGYMAPEFAMEGLYSGKSDVFSFGILLLEIMTGRRNLISRFCPSKLCTTYYSSGIYMCVRIFQNDALCFELINKLYSSLKSIICIYISRLGNYGTKAKDWSWWIPCWKIHAVQMNFWDTSRLDCCVVKKTQTEGQPCRRLI